ncbi:MAG: hypothetical protein HYV63_09630 [Candidatus Schekmanbacteria bacterium]|nr:hypothetical protein [Candidatus Schekmanbacteria bacterium]
MAQTSSHLNHIAERFSALALVLALAGTWGCGGGPEAQVRFDTKPAVSAGDPVVVDEVEVGVVKAVAARDGKTEVAIRINKEHAQRVPSRIVFAVERASGGSGARLVGHVLDASSAPLKDGDSVEGADSSLELTLRQGAQMASRFLDKVKRSMSSLEKTVDDLARDERVQDLSSRFRTIGEELKKLRDDPERAKAEVDRLKSELEELGATLMERGLTPAAERLRKEYEELAEEAAK